jgi:hypothetical protein
MNSTEKFLIQYLLFNIMIWSIWQIFDLSMCVTEGNVNTYVKYKSFKRQVC